MSKPKDMKIVGMFILAAAAGVAAGFYILVWVL